MLVYEEHTDEGEPQKFYGYRDAYKSTDEKSSIPNYALLIYDKRKQGFRIVPIENHVKFEK